MLITLNLKLANNSRNYNITVVSITGLPLHGTLSTGDKPATGYADRATSSQKLIPSNCGQSLTFAVVPRRGNPFKISTEESGQLLVGFSRAVALMTITVMILVLCI